MLEVLFAVLAGILTVGAPCILPLLPILLGSSVGSQSKTRPVFIATGFVVMFSIVGLSLSYLTTALQISPDLLRTIATICLAVFGLFMLWPTPFEKVTAYLSSFTTKAAALSSQAGTGNLGGFILGLMLGLIWTPCAGPVLGSILTLIATQGSTAQSGILLGAYAIGAGIPMLLIAYGGQLITSKVRALAPYTTRIQQVFGVVIILLAVVIYFEYDLIIQAKILENYNFGSLETKFIKPE
jgi:cytochrome c-type biogenesis protein